MCLACMFQNLMLGIKMLGPRLTAWQLFSPEPYELLWEESRELLSLEIQDALNVFVHYIWVTSCRGYTVQYTYTKQSFLKIILTRYIWLKLLSKSFWEKLTPWIISHFDIKKKNISSKYHMFLRQTGQKSPQILIACNFWLMALDRKEKKRAFWKVGFLENQCGVLGSP